LEKLRLAELLLADLDAQNPGIDAVAKKRNEDDRLINPEN
jgi:hypothetical protein